MNCFDGFRNNILGNAIENRGVGAVVWMLLDVKLKYDVYSDRYFKSIT
jgi:hypothetical protein